MQSAMRTNHNKDDVKFSFESIKDEQRSVNDDKNILMGNRATQTPERDLKRRYVAISFYCRVCESETYTPLFLSLMAPDAGVHYPHQFSARTATPFTIFWDTTSSLSYLVTARLCWFRLG